MKKSSSYILFLSLFLIIFSNNAQAASKKSKSATFAMNILSQQTMILNDLEVEVNPALATETDTVFVSGAALLQAQSNGNDGYTVKIAPAVGEPGELGSPFVFAETGGGTDTVEFRLAKDVPLAELDWQAKAPAKLFGQNDPIFNFATQTLASQNASISFVVDKANITSVSAGNYQLALIATLTDY